MKKIIIALITFALIFGCTATPEQIAQYDESYQEILERYPGAEINYNFYPAEYSSQLQEKFPDCIIQNIDYYLVDITDEDTNSSAEILVTADTYEIRCAKQQGNFQENESEESTNNETEENANDTETEINDTDKANQEENKETNESENKETNDSDKSDTQANEKIENYYEVFNVGEKEIINQLTSLPTNLNLTWQKECEKEEYDPVCAENPSISHSDKLYYNSCYAENLGLNIIDNNSCLENNNHYEDNNTLIESEIVQGQMTISDNVLTGNPQSKMQVYPLDFNIGPTLFSASLGYECSEGVPLMMAINARQKRELTGELYNKAIGFFPRYTHTCRISNKVNVNEELRNMYPPVQLRISTYKNNPVDYNYTLIINNINCIENATSFDGTKVCINGEWVNNPSYEKENSIGPGGTDSRLGHPTIAPGQSSSDFINNNRPVVQYNVNRYGTVNNITKFKLSWDCSYNNKTTSHPLQLRVERSSGGNCLVDPEDCSKTCEFNLFNRKNDITVYRNSQNLNYDGSFTLEYILNSGVENYYDWRDRYVSDAQRSYNIDYTYLNGRYRFFANDRILRYDCYDYNLNVRKEENNLYLDFELFPEPKHECPDSSNDYKDFRFDVYSEENLNVKMFINKQEVELRLNPKHLLIQTDNESGYRESNEKYNELKNQSIAYAIEK
jgi:hypothetical protein